MGNLCEVCKKNPAKIQIGDHSYCFDCHNRLALQEMGIDKDFVHAKNISVIEPGGKMHSFEIEHVVLGSIVNWEANEIDGEYCFRLISAVDEDGTAAAQKLFRKIVDGVCSKTLEEHISKWGSSFSLKSKGNIHITEDENNNWATAFEIDGKMFSPEEFADLARGYNGFNIQYQIRDESSPLLSENEYLVPVKVSKELLLQELETALVVTTDRGGFLSYKNVSAFNQLYFKILDKLKILEDALERDKAQETGRAIAKRLREVEHDDDWFPEGNILMICEIVDPDGTDEELQRYLNWE